REHERQRNAKRADDPPERAIGRDLVGGDAIAKHAPNYGSRTPGASSFTVSPGLRASARDSFGVSPGLQRECSAQPHGGRDPGRPKGQASPGVMTVPRVALRHPTVTSP